MLAFRRAVLQARVACLLRQRFAACACAFPEPLQLTEPETGSVPEYHQHVLIKLNPPDGHQEGEMQNGSWWPKFVEKDPAVFEAFKAVVKNQEAISSTIKITAFDDVGARQQLAPGTCDLMAFPEGTWWLVAPVLGRFLMCSALPASANSGRSMETKTDLQSSGCFTAGVRYRNLPLASLGDVVVRLVADEPSELPSLAKDVQRLQVRQQEEGGGAGTAGNKCNGCLQL